MNTYLEPQDLLEPGNNGNYLRDFACEAGATASMLLLELLGYDKCFRESYTSHPKHGDGWFYATEEKILRRTGIKRRQQEADIQTLVDYNFIEVKVFGLPACRHFRINKKAVREFFGLKEELPEWRKRQSSNGYFNNQEEFDQKNILERTKRQTRTDDNPNKNVQKSNLGPINNTHELEYELEQENTNAPHKCVASVCEISPKSPKTSKKSSSKKPTEESGPFIEPAENVKITVSKHEKLIKLYGEELVKEAYAYLSEWKIDNPHKANSHNDYGRIRTWVIKAALKDRETQELIKKQKIAPHRRNSKMVTQGDLDDPSNFKLRRF